MPHHVLQTKCYVPVEPVHRVVRPQLLAHLSAGVQAGHKLSLIAAPAGYGKTSLVASWLRSSALPVAWLSLDSYDNELPRFLTYLSLALQQSRARWPDQPHEPGFALAAVLSAPQLPPLAELAAMIGHDLHLLGVQAQTLGQPRFLVALDDYHRITATSIHTLLTLLLEHLPPACQVLLLTREDPPLPLARLRARGSLTEIRAQELRFDQTEAATFFNQAMDLALSAEGIATLATRTEGWIASLHLAALSLRGRDAAQTAAFIESFGGSHRYVFDYLAEEVLARQSPTIQAFLQQTAILDRFNAELCAAVTTRQDSQALLLQLEQANLFLVPLDDVRTWYRYHHLFADYLRSLLPVEQHREGYRRAVAWLREQALWVDAVQYALATADSDLVAAVIEQALGGSSSWSSGNLTMLASWIDALPASVFPHRPRLSLHTARVCYLTGRLEQADQHIDEAETCLQARGATLASEPLLALAAVYRGASAAMRGDAAQAISQITAVQPYLPPDHYLAHARANFSLGLASELAAQTTQALSYYEQTAAQAQAAGVLFLELHAQGAAAQLQLQQGRLTLAAERCQAARMRAAGARIAPLGLLLVLLGGIALERNQLVLASQQIHEGLTLAQQGGLWNDAVVGLRLASRLAVAQGDETTAMQLLDEAALLIERHGVPRLQQQVAAARARLQIQLGQVAAANAWAASYQTSRMTLPSEVEDLILGRWWLAHNQPAALLRLIPPVLAQARVAGRDHHCLEALLLLSRAAQAMQDQAAACDWLAQALALAEPEGYVRIVLEEGPTLLALLPQLRQVAPAYRATLLAQVKPEVTPAAAETHLAPVKPEVAPAATNTRLAQVNVDGDQYSAAPAGLIEPLSEQERRVLRLIVAGKSNHEIAETLVISVGTAKWHVHNILQKLAVKNRPQAIARARALGLEG